MILKLYHSSKEIINKPDIHYGRKNADFGQGFYLSDNLDFSYKWSNKDSYINIYELDLFNLKIKRFKKDNEWFNYIFSNRKSIDKYKEYDVIIGPISNDTIYNSYGILTSGLINKQLALKLLMLGKDYTQIVIKSDKALNNLKYIKYIKPDLDKLNKLNIDRINEENKYQDELAKIINNN